MAEPEDTIPVNDDVVGADVVGGEQTEEAEVTAEENTPETSGKTEGETEVVEETEQKAENTSDEANDTGKVNTASGGDSQSQAITSDAGTGTIEEADFTAGLEQEENSGDNGGEEVNVDGGEEESSEFVIRDIEENDNGDQENNNVIATQTSARGEAEPVHDNEVVDGEEGKVKDSEADEQVCAVLVYFIIIVLLYIIE